MTDRRIVVVLGLVFAAALVRLLPHPPNFAPMAAMALFSGAYIADRRLAFLAPLAAMLVSDLVIGFHAGIVLVYVCMAIAVAFGMGLRSRLRALPIAGATLATSVMFFVITNFGVWTSSGMYPLTPEGLIACYVAAVPFFHYTVLGDAFYALVLFGGYALYRRTRSAPDAAAVRTSS